MMCAMFPPGVATRMTSDAFICDEFVNNESFILLALYTQSFPPLRIGLILRICKPISVLHTNPCFITNSELSRRYIFKAYISLSFVQIMKNSKIFLILQIGKLQCVIGQNLLSEFVSWVLIGRGL